MISEFPLFCFTTLAGLAAGVYAVGAVFPVGKGSKRVWLFPLVCLVLLMAGLLGLPAHLGRPERMLIALTHPTAMIAQEAYWSMALGAVLAVDLVLSKLKGSAPRALRVAGAVFALALMCVMANGYFVSLAVPMWSSWTTFPLFVLGDLAMGAAAAAVLDRMMRDRRATGGNAEVPTLAAHGVFNKVELALAVLAAAAFVAEAVLFAGLGLSAVPFAVAAVLAVAGAGVSIAARKGALPEGAAVWLAFACLFVAVAVARYAFYAAYAL